MFERVLVRVRRQITARHGPITGGGAIADVVLGRRALYILPTREGLYYAAMLLVMLLAAVNYSNGLAYALTFMLGAVAVVATLHTHRNLSGLRLSPGPAPPVFAGSTAVFTVIVHNDTDLPRQSVEIAGADRTHRVHIPARGAATVEISAPAPRRGYLSAPPIRLRTRFPVGLWHAWSRRVAFPVQCLIYPRPAPEQPLPHTADPHAGHGAAGGTEGEDFDGLRDYRHGDPMQRVAWKKVAAGQGWYTKQFAAPASHLVWLEWSALARMPLEDRLSMLCRWILMAEQHGIAYGLRLPGATIAPARGAIHRDRCLERLALFESGA